MPHFIILRNLNSILSGSLHWCEEFAGQQTVEWDCNLIIENNEIGYKFKFKSSESAIMFALLWVK
jgi:hypothetical protein